jgi:hypothetical protein
MRNPPKVRADIILDPYLHNIVPKSLGFTAAYVVTLAICSWFLASLSLRSVRLPPAKVRQE